MLFFLADPKLGCKLISTPPLTCPYKGLPQIPGANNDKVLRAQQFKVSTTLTVSPHVPLRIEFESLKYLSEAA